MLEKFLEQNNIKSNINFNINKRYNPINIKKNGKGNKFI